MASSFAWLDYCESERRKALDLIHAFRDQGTLDELGIGTTRDALSDLLFPGTSNIQTRAKYHLFIPWMYQELEQEIASRGRYANKQAIEREAQADNDPHGTSGRRERSRVDA